MCETQELKMLLIPHFLLAFYELIHLCSNQSLRNLLCFTSRCENLIRTYPRSKKNLVSDRENFTYWEEPERIEVLTNKCGLFQKNSQGFWVVAAVQTLENFYPHLSLKTVFPSLNLLQNCQIMNIGCPSQHIYPT